jgi:hypothetical protein
VASHYRLVSWMVATSRPLVATNKEQTSLGSKWFLRRANEAITGGERFRRRLGLRF